MKTYLQGFSAEGHRQPEALEIETMVMAETVFCEVHNVASRE